MMVLQMVALMVCSMDAWQVAEMAVSMVVRRDYYSDYWWALN